MAEFEKVVKLKVVSINDLASRNIIKLYADLETSLDTAWNDKDVRAKLDVMNQKALTSLKQRLRRQKVEIAKELEIFLSVRRRNPLLCLRNALLV